MPAQTARHKQIRISKFETRNKEQMKNLEFPKQEKRGSKGFVFVI